MDESTVIASKLNLLRIALLLEQDPPPSLDERKQAAESLREIANSLEAPEPTIGSWVMKDFQTKADELGLTLTEDQLEDAFSIVDGEFDASIGINWDSIEQAVLRAAKS